MNPVKTVPYHYLSKLLNNDRTRIDASLYFNKPSEYIANCNTMCSWITQNRCILAGVSACYQQLLMVIFIKHITHPHKGRESNIGPEACPGVNQRITIYIQIS